MSIGWFVLCVTCVYVAMSMQLRVEQRTNIKFGLKLGWGARKTWRKLQDAYGDRSLLHTQVRMWFKRFADGEVGVQDKKCSGRPKTRSDKSQQIAAALDVDRRKTVR